jgi:hypothetical protein
MRKTIPTVVMFAAAIYAAALMLSTAASAWSEKNCQALCRSAAAGAEDVAECIRLAHCERYRGKREDSAARVKAVEAKWRAWNGWDQTHRWRKRPPFPNW